MIFLKKLYGNMICSSNVLKRWSYQKSSTEIWSFLYYLERWYFFFTRKYDIFSLDGKWKMIFLKKIYWNMIFSGCMYKCYKYDITLLPKQSKTIFSRENTLKGDCILGWHSRKSSNDSLYFYGDLHRRFHILLSSEKKNRKFNI